VLVRPGEHGPDGGARIAARVEEVEAAVLVAQVVEQVGQARASTGRGEFGRDPKGQRQPGAALRECGGRVRVGVDPPADERA
jgi:hypothetical protein